MQCKIEGCDSPVMYKTQSVCQRHYFRYMRNGTYDLVRKRKYRVRHSLGYEMVYDPEHPLASKNGYVYEHRKVFYDHFGLRFFDCSLCGKTCDWSVYKSHIDHINRDRSDNRIDNLRMLCNGCNSHRDFDVRDRSGVTVIEINGEKKTAWQWAKVDGATHSGASILSRYRKGLDPKYCVFGKNMTHPKNEMA